MGSACSGGDLYFLRRDDAGATGDEAQRDIVFCAAARSGSDGVLEGAVPATVLERSGRELAEEWAGSLPGGVAYPPGVGVQFRGDQPCECLGADATAAVGGQVD